MGPPQKSRKLVRTINISLRTIRQLKEKITEDPIIIVMDLKEDIIISLPYMSEPFCM
jgi:hypothetical protein